MKNVMSRIVLAGLVVCSGITVALTAQGSRPPQNEDVLPQLLIEVRGLRAALEQMALAGPRVQLALGRVQLQEQRIGNQTRRLDAVRSALAAAQTELEPLERKAKEMQQILRDFPNSEGRPVSEAEFAELKTELARRYKEIGRLTAEESLLVQDIATEQSRWTDFNQRLEELERALGRP